MADFDTGFSLVPSEDELTVDERLDAALSGLIPDEGDEAPQPLGRGWLFDFQKGEFVQRGDAPLEVSETDHLAVWVEKTLRTSRFAHPIYSDEYGMEDPWEPYGQSFTAGLSAKVADHIRGALLVHDRISQVTDFTFDGDPASSVLAISFRVVLDDDEDNQLEFTDMPITRFS